MTDPVALARRFWPIASRAFSPGTIPYGGSTIASALNAILGCCLVLRLATLSQWQVYIQANIVDLQIDHIQHTAHCLLRDGHLPLPFGLVRPLHGVHPSPRRSPRGITNATVFHDTSIVVEFVAGPLGDYTFGCQLRRRLSPMVSYTRGICCTCRRHGLQPSEGRNGREVRESPGGEGEGDEGTSPHSDEGCRY